MKKIALPRGLAYSVSVNRQTSLEQTFKAHIPNVTYQNIGPVKHPFSA